MNRKANQEIRLICKARNIALWQVADKLGIADTTFSKHLRRELSAAKKQEILRIIEDLRSEAKEATDDE